MYANEYYLCGTNNFLKRKLKIFIIDVSFGKKKGCEQKRNDCSLNHAFFFSLLSPKTVFGLTISCVRKEEDSQSNENDDQSNRNFPIVDIATLTKRVTHFVLYISV